MDSIFDSNLFFLINIRRKFNFDHDLISILFFVAHSKQSKIQYNSSLLQCWAYFFLVGSYKSFCILAHLVSRLCLDHQILFYNNSNSLVSVTTIFSPCSLHAHTPIPKHPNKKEIKHKIFTMKLRINIHTLIKC